METKHSAAWANGEHERTREAALAFLARIKLMAAGDHQAAAHLYPTSEWELASQHSLATMMLLDVVRAGHGPWIDAIQAQLLAGAAGEDL